MVLPARHVASPFDLTAEEWAATQELLVMLRNMLDDRFQPDGYNVGWNVDRSAVSRYRMPTAT